MNVGMEMIIFESTSRRRYFQEAPAGESGGVVDGQHGKRKLNSSSFTLPETNILPLKIALLKRKGSSPKHHFSGAKM